MQQVKLSYDELKNEIAVIANSEFLQYFTTNWETCKSMWDNYLCDQYLHLANTTNNHLECHHHKLKDLISCTSSHSEMFDHVLTFSVIHALDIHKNHLVKSSHLIRQQLITFYVPMKLHLSVLKMLPI